MTHEASIVNVNHCVKSKIQGRMYCYSAVNTLLAAFNIGKDSVVVVRLHNNCIVFV